MFQIIDFATSRDQELNQCVLHMMFPHVNPRKFMIDLQFLKERTVFCELTLSLRLIEKPKQFSNYFEFFRIHATLLIII